MRTPCHIMSGQDALANISPRLASSPVIGTARTKQVHSRRNPAGMRLIFIQLDCAKTLPLFDTNQNGTTCNTGDGQPLKPGLPCGPSASSQLHVVTQLALVECPVLFDTMRDNRPSRMSGAEQTRISDLQQDRLPPVLGTIVMTFMNLSTRLPLMSAPACLCRSTKRST